MAAAATELPPAAGEAAGEAVAAGVELPPITRMLSSQRPPPSPFEGVPAAAGAAPPEAAAPKVHFDNGVAAAAEAAAAEAEAAEDGQPKARSPRGIAPTKSALKLSKDKEAAAEAKPQPGSMDAQPSRTLTWADTHHGRDIHHVQEYQPSDHGSDSFAQRALGCNCCIQ